MSHPTPRLFSQALPGLSHPALSGSRHSTRPQPLSCPMARPPPSVRLSSPLSFTAWLLPWAHSLRTWHAAAQTPSYSSLEPSYSPVPSVEDTIPWLPWKPAMAPLCLATFPTTESRCPKLWPQPALPPDVSQLPTQKGDRCTGLERAPGLSPPRFFLFSSPCLEWSLPTHPDQVKHSQVWFSTIFIKSC